MYVAVERARTRFLGIGDSGNTVATFTSGRLGFQRSDTGRNTLGLRPSV